MTFTPTPPSDLLPHHVAVKTSRVDTLVDFYVRVLGLNIRDRHHDADGALRSVWVQAGDFILMIERLESAGNSPSAAPRPFSEDAPGWHLFALSIPPETRADWKNHFIRHQIPIAHETPYSLYIQDPEGNRLALSHYPQKAALL